MRMRVRNEFATFKTEGRRGRCMEPHRASEPSHNEAFKKKKEKNCQVAFTTCTSTCSTSTSLSISPEKKSNFMREEWLGEDGWGMCRTLYTIVGADLGPLIGSGSKSGSPSSEAAAARHRMGYTMKRNLRRRGQ